MSETIPVEKIEPPHKLNYVSRIAGRMDTKSRRMAKRLHDLRLIYALYGALDGLSNSYSFLKYWIDLALTNSDLSSSDVMHELLLTPAGIAVAATESITLITLAMLGNYFDDKDKNRFKRYIATVWPYLRDVIKGSKNTYKGLRSTMQMMNVLGGPDLNSMLVPASLCLGAVAILNRLWMRRMQKNRKDMMKANAVLLAKIQDAHQLTEEECLRYRKQLQLQSKDTRIAAFGSVALGAVIDSLYLFVGTMFLAPVAWPLFVMMVTFSAIYAVSLIATRLYEEYDYQRKLLITEAKVELALSNKELGPQIVELLRELQDISKQLAELSDSKEDLLRRAELEELQTQILQELDEKKGVLNAKRQRLQSLSTLSYSSALLVGAKNGLAAYSAVASLLFTTATILLLTSTPFPPLLLIVGVSLGMACLLGFIIHSLIKNYIHNSRQKKKQEHEPYERLEDILKTLKSGIPDVEELNLDVEIDSILENGMVVDPSPQFFFQEWFEVVRSFFSGLGKGSKSVDYTMNPFQERDEQGHYHDTPIMLGVTVFSSLVYSLALALNALTRGFGRTPPDQVDVPAKDVKKSASSGREEDKDQPDIEPYIDEPELLPLVPPADSSIRESGPASEPTPDSQRPKITRSFSLSFFPPPATSKTSKKTYSKDDIGIGMKPKQVDVVSSNTIRGLM
ncbi:FlxA-like family protein [Legionella spiritensis]|uniref:FlxA-like family protein n=1 Tax=Legionella spiritensis TaxID=452 RepID=UPI000F83BF2C|nr:FlxA-like family protein [Legionella spiritensis]